MDNSAYKNIKGEICVFDFEDFIPTSDTPIVNNRILDFMTVGPFVLPTDGAFEAEHFYEREKILLEDYLLEDGGERSICPYLGMKVRNKYYGAEYLSWVKGFIKWNALRFDSEEDACDDALYATEQRNAVYYAAFYVDCKKEESAVICYENSGSTLFVNGEEADFKPYGRVKGLWGMGYQVCVRFKEGRNLVMFKIRPGYIADSMDISMSNCSIFPIAVETDGIGITYPTVTKAFVGDRENPAQVFPAFIAATKDTDGAVLSYVGGGYSGEEKIEAAKQGSCRIYRFAIGGSGNVPAEITVEGKENKASKTVYFPVSEFDGFTGNERIFSDFHFDTTYHQEQRTYALGAFHITKSIVDRLISNPDFKAILSEIDYLHPYFSIYPHHRKALLDAFREGSAEADCFYNQPNDLTSSGEAFVRNLVYGQLYHRDVLGRKCFVYSPGDVFGHFSQLSQVCKKGSCISLKWGKYMLGVDTLFNHISPDGTYMLHDKGNSRQTALRHRVKSCDASSVALSHIEAYPREGDTAWMEKTLSHAKFSVFSELHKDILESVSENTAKDGISPIDFTSRDITQHHSGVILTRTDFKQANRLCENLLVTAEKFASIAAMYGAEYPEKLLDKAWRQLLCGQHHDSITGTNNEISFVDLMLEYRESAALAAGVIQRAAEFIASGVKTGKDKNIFVFNPHLFDRSEKCEFLVPEEDYPENGIVLCDTKGNEYPVEKISKTDNAYKCVFVTGKIPSLGYAVYKIKEKECVCVQTGASDCTIENNRYKLSVDPERGGGIVSLWDKKEKREVIDKNNPHPANTINVLKEIHDRMETQHEIYTTGHKLLSDEYEAQVTSEKNDVFQRLYISVQLDCVAKVNTEITLYKNSDSVDFKCIVEDYQSEDDLFTVTFPVNVKGGAVVFDDRFAPHISTASKKEMSFQTHQYASFSGCRILPANQWFGVSPSVTVNLADNSSFNIGMTALVRKEDFATRKCAERLMFALSRKAVPVTAYPDVQQEHHGSKIIHFNEDIYSTDTRFVLCLENDKNEYAEKLFATLKNSTKTKVEKLFNKNGFVWCYFSDNDNIYKKNVDVLVLKARDANILSFCIEKIENDIRNAYTVNIENIVADTLPEKADEYSVFMLNNGTPACSVEGKKRNILNMMLFHTAAFYGNAGKVTGGKELVPEQKTHVFTYSLYPHKNSYREAAVYPKAFAFNDPLFAVNNVHTRENAFLPEEKSFMRVNGAFAVTALKPGGYPLASLKNKREDILSRGIVLRGFETDGVNSALKITSDFSLFGAVKCDLLEENTEPVQTSSSTLKQTVSPHSIETFIMKAMPCEIIERCNPYVTSEALQPVFTRSWEHDMGSLPMGYMAVSAVIDKKSEKISENKTRLYINTANNFTDASVEFKVQIECSEGLTADKTEIDCNLTPLQADSTPIVITAENGTKEGIVRIFYEYDSQVFTDVFEFGCFTPEVSLKIENKRAVCTLRNTTSQNLSGTLMLASPYETWDYFCFNQSATGNVTPYEQKFSINSGEIKKYEFDISFYNDDIVNSCWLAVKLCVNGRIRFAFDKRQGERHNVWAHEFIDEIYNDGGSIRKLLEM